MKRRTIVLIGALALVAAACGDDSVGTTTTDVAPTTTTTTEPEATTTTVAETTTTQAAAEVVFTGADGVESTISDTSRIVSLGGDITEIIFELGLGDQVAAIDVTTTHPEAATELPMVGFGQQLAPEPVLAFQPTLVIGDEMTAPPEAIDQLRAAGIPVVILPLQTTLDGVSEKIRQVAQLLSAEEAGEELVARVEADIAAAGTIDDPDLRVAYVYVRGPQLLLLFGQGVATNAMIVGAGAVDAGAEANVFGAAPLAGEAGAFLAYDEAFFFNLGPRAGLALQQFVTDLADFTAS